VCCPRPMVCDFEGSRKRRRHKSISGSITCQPAVPRHCDLAHGVFWEVLPRSLLHDHDQFRRSRRRTRSCHQCRSRHFLPASTRKQKKTDGRTNFRRKTAVRKGPFSCARHDCEGAPAAPKPTRALQPCQRLRVGWVYTPPALPRWLVREQDCHRPTNTSVTQTIHSDATHARKVQQSRQPQPSNPAHSHASWRVITTMF
jgi:hypothetical protein